MPPTEAQTKPAPRSVLPKEIWGEVLWHVDDPYDLWVSCRQVSFMFKHEAERTFHLRHLPHLKILYVRDDLVEEADDCGICTVELNLDTSHTDLGTPAGRFHLQIGSIFPDLDWIDGDPEPQFVNFRSENHRAYAIRQCLDWQDVNALSRSEGCDKANDINHRMLVWFDPAPRDKLDSCLGYINDVEIPEMEVYLGAFSQTGVPDFDGELSYQMQGYATLNWKSLLTAFFAEENFVRRKLAETGTPRGPQSLFDQCMASLSRRCPSLERLEHGYRISEYEERKYEIERSCFVRSAGAHDAQHISLYEAAYDARLRKAYAQIGLETPGDIRNKKEKWTKKGPGAAEYEKHIRSHCEHFRRHREEKRAAYAEKYWDYKVGNIVFVKETVAIWDYKVGNRVSMEEAEDDTENENDEELDGCGIEEGGEEESASDHCDDDGDLEEDIDKFYVHYDDDRRVEDFSVKEWKPLKKREQPPQSKKVLKKNKKGKRKW